MRNSKQYFHDHIIAKVAIYFSYVGVGIGSIETGNPYLALVLGTGLWLFGINSVAYCVETIRGHEHQHKQI